MLLTTGNRNLEVESVGVVSYFTSKLICSSSFLYVTFTVTHVQPVNNHGGCVINENLNMQVLF